MAKRQLSELQKLYAREVKAAGGRPGRPGGGRPGGPRPKGKPKNTKQTISRLWKYVANYKLLLVLVIILMMCNTVTSLAGSYILRPVINNVADRSIPGNDRLENLFVILIVIAIIYVIGILANYFQQRLMLTIAHNAVEKLRNDLFMKLF